MLKRSLQISLVSLYAICFTGCSQGTYSGSQYEKPGYNFPYLLDKPDNTWKLPASLLEISGLGYIDENRLGCVQDEQGIIYIFNTSDGKIEREINFGDAGDHEGIEIINDDAWVLKSNGTLVEVKNYLREGVKTVQEYPTLLSIHNDTEGLAYDPAGGRLLIACKESPYLRGESSGDSKAVYIFDLTKKILDEKPFMMIRNDSVIHFKSLIAGSIDKHETGSGKKPKKEKAPFKPSGIAVHPLTGDVYLLASVGNMLLVFSRTATLNAIVELDPVKLPKPEGICFGPDGTMFIASEGKGNAGTIMKFNPVNR